MAGSGPGGGAEAAAGGKERTRAAEGAGRTGHDNGIVGRDTSEETMVYRIREQLEPPADGHAVPYGPAARDRACGEL